MSLRRVGVLASGGGSNFEALAQFARDSKSFEIALLIASRPGIGALERATRHAIPAAVIGPADFASEEAFQKALVDALVKANVEVVALAGYLRKLGAPILDRYAGRILNIHPALLPKYGGPGMYGHFVHEAVVAAKEKESGCTVHLVDEQYDHGRILAQATVAVLPTDTPKTLADRVLAEEHRLYPHVLKEFCERL